MKITIEKISDDDGYAYCLGNMRVDIYPPDISYDGEDFEAFAYFSSNRFYNPKDMRDLAKLFLKCADVLEKYQKIK